MATQASIVSMGYQKLTYLCRDGYIVGYSYTTKQPVWVAYQLTGKSVDHKIKRNDNFRPDPAITARHGGETPSRGDPSSPGFILSARRAVGARASCA